MAAVISPGWKKRQTDINDLRAGRRTRNLTVDYREPSTIAAIWNLCGFVVVVIGLWKGASFFDQIVASSLCFVLAQLCEINASLKASGGRQRFNYRQEGGLLWHRER